MTTLALEETTISRKIFEALQGIATVELILVGGQHNSWSHFVEQNELLFAICGPRFLSQSAAFSASSGCTTSKDIFAMKVLASLKAKELYKGSSDSQRAVKKELQRLWRLVSNIKVVETNEIGKSISKSISNFTLCAKRATS